MKELNQSKTFTVELTEAEVEAIHSVTQNHPNPDSTAGKVYLGLFVGMGRLLNINLDDDGSILSNECGWND